jgi:hypothetical protein
MTQKEKYIAELEKLNSYEELLNFDAQILDGEWKFKPIAEYIQNLFAPIKPETASSILLKAIVTEILDARSFSEKSVKDGFIDLAIQENVVNPIMIELKPYFILNKEKGLIKRKELQYQNNKSQVQKYLQSNDYIVLTNLKTAYIFNREAILDYKPFKEIAFTDLLKGFLEYNSLWDTIRRYEDNIIKPELDKEFFSSLKVWYNELDQIEFEQPNGLEKQELIVLLMNKIIFIKTLEDYGLIKYKMLQDTYFETFDLWETKGLKKFFEVFFRTVEEWFWEYYDTELFKINVWDYVKKTDKNLKLFKIVYERVLGVGAWELTFGKGMIHYNYRQIDEDVFGKAYETFIAENKKDSGIYYTPKPITKYMSDRMVKLLFEPIAVKIEEAINKADYKTAEKYLVELQKIKFVDTCSGSGSFLIKILKDIYQYYEKFDVLTSSITKVSSGDIFNTPQYILDAIEFRKKAMFDDKRRLIGSIVLNHICAIDIDDRALETAKTNIWKEAVKLNPYEFAFKKLPEDVNHVLPNLELNFINADALFDLPLDEEIAILTKDYSTHIAELQAIRKKYIEDAYHPETLDKVKSIKAEVRKELTKLLPPLTKPTLIALEFFFLFFDEDGNPLPIEERGFAGIISNPPWETIKPIKKEFAKIGKGEMQVKDFDKWLDKKLLEDDEFKARWEKYLLRYEKYNEFLHERYTYQGIGDPNFYKLLIERNIEVVQPNGYINLLIPSGIQTDAGCSDLRKMIFDTLTLSELSSFENRGYVSNVDGVDKTIKLFPDVDNRFKFTAMFIQKKQSKKGHSFDGRFYLLDPEELNNPPMKYDVEMIKKFSPDNLSIMEFESEKDFRLCTSIRGNHELLLNSGYKFRAELHMTNDRRLYTELRNYEGLKNKKEYLPLYEGKMIHQFKNDYAEPNYFVKEEEAKKLLLGKEISRIHKTNDKKVKSEDLYKDFDKQGFQLDYQDYRMVYRTVGGSTNERTIISTILPKKCFIGHSMNHLVYFDHYMKGKKIMEDNMGQESQVYLMSVLNSLVLNYYIRNKISANLTMNFMYELPMPQADEMVYKKIIELGFNLLYHASNSKLFEDLAKALNIKPAKDFDSIKSRAELEVLIAKELFGLSKDDWKYLTSTFVYGDESTTKKELDQIIAESIKLY